MLAPAESANGGVIILSLYFLLTYLLTHLRVVGRSQNVQ